jgi:hypothetical protein
VQADEAKFNMPKREFQLNPKLKQLRLQSLMVKVILDVHLHEQQLMMMKVL